MKKASRYLYSIATILLVGILMSYTAGGDKKPAHSVKVYLGNSNYTGGLIAKKVFDSLLQQGIKARDSAGNNVPVLGFTFSYGERNLYEDANGRPVVMTEYLSEYCPGDTLSPSFQLFVFRDNRTKHGDTVYFDKIKFRNAAGVVTNTEKMRFVLTK